MDTLPDELIVMMIRYIHNPVTISGLLSTSTRMRNITIEVIKSLVGPCKVSVPSTWLSLFDLRSITNITVHLDSELPEGLKSCSINMLSYQLGVEHLRSSLRGRTLRLIWGFNMYAIIREKNVLLRCNDIVFSQVMHLMNNDCTGYCIPDETVKTRHHNIKMIYQPTCITFLNKWGVKLIESMDIDNLFPSSKSALKSGVQPSTIAIIRLIESYAIYKSGKKTYNQGRLVMSGYEGFSDEVRGFFAPIIAKKGCHIETSDINIRLRDYVLPMEDMSLSQLEDVDPSTFPIRDNLLLSFKNDIFKWYLDLAS